MAVEYEHYALAFRRSLDREDIAACVFDGERAGCQRVGVSIANAFSLDNVRAVGKFGEVERVMIDTNTAVAVDLDFRFE